MICMGNYKSVVLGPKAEKLIIRAKKTIILYLHSVLMNRYLIKYELRFNHGNGISKYLRESRSVTGILGLM